MNDGDVRVVLTWLECSEGAREGVNRRLRRLSRGRSDRFGWDGQRDEWGSDIESAAAEIAVAKATGSYWAPSDKPDYDGDVNGGGGWHVRHTTRADGNLILYPTDRDDGRYVLVIGRLPIFAIKGWILGTEGKREEWAAGTRLRVPGFLVPRCALCSIEASVESVAS